MKKVALAVVVLAIALIATSASAFDVKGVATSVPGAPSEVNSAVGTATDMATTSAMSQDAQKKIDTYGCKFKDKKSTDIVCSNGKSIDALMTELQKTNKTGKLVAGKYLTIDAKVSCDKNCSERRSTLENSLSRLDGKWWHYNVGTAGKGDSIRMTASAN
jgi:hypothetical protein